MDEIRAYPKRNKIQKTKQIERKKKKKKKHNGKLSSVKEQNEGRGEKPLLPMLQIKKINLSEASTSSYKFKSPKKKCTPTIQILCFLFS